jgi:plastocyanin
VSRVAAFAFAVAVLALGSGRAASALDPPGAATRVEGTVVVKVAPSSQGAVVTLEAPGKKGPPPAAITVDQQRLQFRPHLSVVPLGSTVRFLNSDKEPHNVYSPEGRYNLGVWGPGDAREHTFAQAGAYTQLCNLHPDMLAFVVVVDTPYFAVTDAKGAFVVRGVPPGKYKLSVWHEKSDGLEREVEVVAGKPRKLELVLAK